MALLTAPLMSLDASGTVAKTLVFSKWKGRNYVRQHVIPSNPQSPLQVADRASLAFLSQAWKAISPTDQATWKDLADAGKFSEFNAYLRANQKAFANFDPPTQATPAAHAATPGVIANLTATVDNKLVSIFVRETANITDWGVLICLDTSAIAACTRGLTVKEAPYFVNVIELNANVTLGPFKPGTYHINARGFTADGVWSADFGDVAFTVT